MKYLKQMTIILAVTLMGEVIKYFIPFPIPASIYGLILMFVFLMTNVIKIENVKDQIEAEKNAWKEVFAD